MLSSTSVILQKTSSNIAAPEAAKNTEKNKLVKRMVHRKAWRRDGRWPVAGHRPLLSRFCCAKCVGFQVGPLRYLWKTSRFGPCGCSPLPEKGPPPG